MSSAYFRCMLSRFILIYSYKALDERFTQKMDEVTKLIRHALAVREDTGGHCGIRFGVAATVVAVVNGKAPRQIPAPWYIY